MMVNCLLRSRASTPFGNLVVDRPCYEVRRVLVSLDCWESLKASEEGLDDYDSVQSSSSLN